MTPNAGGHRATEAKTWPPSRSAMYDGQGDDSQGATGRARPLPWAGRPRLWIASNRSRRTQLG